MTLLPWKAPSVPNRRFSTSQGDWGRQAHGSVPEGPCSLHISLSLATVVPLIPWPALQNDSADNASALPIPEWPVTRGQVTDWETLEKVWTYGFMRFLRIVIL